MHSFCEFSPRALTRPLIRRVVSLVFGLTLVSLLFAVYQVEAENRSKRNELERRAQILAESLQEAVEALPEKGSQETLHQIVEEFGSRQGLAGVVIYNRDGKPLWMTSALAEQFGTQLPLLDHAVFQRSSRKAFFPLGQTEMMVYALPLRSGEHVVGALAVFDDATYINAQNAKMWGETFVRVLVQMFVVAGITILIIRWSMVAPIRRMAQWMKDLRVGKEVSHSELVVGGVLQPLTKEVIHPATTSCKPALQPKRKHDCAMPASRCGRRNGYGFRFKARWRVGDCSWFPAIPLRPLCLPLDWLPRWSRSCAPLMERGLRTALAMRIVQTGTRVSPCNGS
jgi:hypothetical protein